MKIKNTLKGWYYNFWLFLGITERKREQPLYYLSECSGCSKRVYSTTKQPISNDFYNSCSDFCKEIIESEVY